MACLWAIVSVCTQSLRSEADCIPGNFLGPLVFKSEEAPGYRTGWITTVATSSTAIVLAIVYRFVCQWENKRRDRSGELEAFEHAYEDDLTDKTNPQFRYTL